MHPDQLQQLALDHQAALLAQAERIRAGRPLGGRVGIRRRWRGAARSR